MKWNEVTWYSKLAALIFFLIILPIWTFYLGTQYELTKSALVQPPVFSNTPQNQKNTLNIYSQYNFTFQYPSEVNVYPNRCTFINVGNKSSDQVVKEFDGFLVLLGSDHEPGDGDCNNYSLIRGFVIDNQEAASFEVWANNKIQDYNKIFQTDATQIVSVGSEKAVKLDKTDLLAYIFYNPQSGEEVEIDLEPKSTQEKSQYLETYNQIVSTFHFTD